MINKPNDTKKTNLLGFDLKALKDYFSILGEKPFRATQLLKWIHQQKVTDFSEMLNLSKPLREKLQDNCEISAPKIVSEKISSDGTVKWLMEVQGKNFIETVFIPEEKRGTLCISSQVGCMLTCKFCSTAKQGFNSNLSSTEVIGQLWRANVRLQELGKIPCFDKIPDITNVVMMGMGEPLFNFDNVVRALKIMRDDNAYGLSWKRVTLSTSGVVPQIYKLGEEVDVALAISLHAPNDKIRSSIMPINNKYPISVLLDACKGYIEKNPRIKITIEYVMLRGINDSAANAKELARLLSDLPCKINLIPFNPFPGSGYECSNKKDIFEFRNILMNRGYIATIRKTRGDDIDAACGQLAGDIIDKTKRNQRYKEHLSSIEK